MEVLEESQQALPPSNWWVDLARDASNNIVPVEGETIEAFARKCYRLFFQQKMGKEMYFQCCTLAWMVQCLDRGMMAEQLWKATRLVLHHQVQMVMDGEDSCLTGWILPTFQMQDLDLPGTVPLGDSEERYIYLLIHLWKQFYKACEEPLPARPIKRQRTTYHYYSSSTSPLDDLMKGSYKLSTVILWSNVILNIGDSIHSWQELHDLVHLLPRIFKTLTADDIQAGLAVVGMQCLMDGTKISGLTPGALLNNYLTRTGYVNVDAIVYLFQIIQEPYTDVVVFPFLSTENQLFRFSRSPLHWITILCELSFANIFWNPYIHLMTAT